MSAITEAPTRLVASAADRVLDRLRDGDQYAVVHEYAHSVLLRGEGGLLALTDPAAAQSTCAVRVVERSLADLNLCEVGAVLTVRQRLLVGDHVTIAVARTWPSSVPRLTAPRAQAVMRFRALLQTASVGLPQRPSHAPFDPAELIGLGPGLTPSGDDIVCGYLAAVHAWGSRAHRARVADDCVRHIPATTALSGQFIVDAAAGHACAELREFLMALARGDAEPAYRALLRIGHTSGADLAVGVLSFLDHIHSPDTHSPDEEVLWP